MACGGQLLGQVEGTWPGPAWEQGQTCQPRTTEDFQGEFFLRRDEGFRE